MKLDLLPTQKSDVINECSPREYADDFLVDYKIKKHQRRDPYKQIYSRSERGYLVRILASRPGVPGSNPIVAPKSLVMN